MEKAIIKKLGKGWNVTFSVTGRSMSLAWTDLPSDIDGKEIDVKREKGQIEEIIYNGKSFKKTVKNIPLPQNNYRGKPQPDNNQKRHPPVRDAAFAPYNFIPLNDKVIDGQEFPGHNRFDPVRLSGYIDLSIRAITPLFIRGRDANFLQIDGKPILPGSSIRGLIRNVVEIISYGKFQTNKADDRNLYFRSVADKSRSTLKYLYESNISIDTIKAGYLLYNKETRDYSIQEAEAWDREAKILPEFHYEKKDDSWLVLSGKMPNKKRNWKVMLPTTIKYDVDSNLIKSYEEDFTRNIKFDILKSARENKFNDIKLPIGVPVFFQLENGTITSFGHTGFYRLPYKKRIFDAIPKSLLQGEDFTDLIFGTTKHASRVYFEDALPIQNKPVAYVGLNLQPKILSSPKPTTVQHYLENSGNDISKLNHWDTKSAKIRGNKMYWHRSANSSDGGQNLWMEERGRKEKSHPDPINPLKSDSEFVSRIRFDNLTNEELGCLLTAIQLPEGCYHKLGMGKPLGLGSVHITASLTIIDRKERYNELFDEKGWYGGESSDKDIAVFQTAFQQLVSKNVERDKQQNFWSLERMYELKTMLTWRHTEKNDWLEKTRYMEIERPDSNERNEYKNRPVLPKPSEVIKL